MERATSIAELKCFNQERRSKTPDLAPWSAADRWSNLRDELNSFFEMPFRSSFGQAGQLFTGWSPALDLYESGDNVVAVVELPGMRKEDIDISLHDGTLTISGERKRESANGEKAQRTERYVGTFRRSITLPTRVDAGKVGATYQDGILKVILPKAEEAKPKQIKVS
ncbi:MAG: heat-shock protein Hsp20 [Verrucomicrobia bacterium]|nr:MAG: heat-shock protein Hsp20 [Verrucomicrobiota bacterium]